MLRFWSDCQRWATRCFNVAAPVNYREDAARLKGSIGFTQQGHGVCNVQKIEDHGVALRAIGYPASCVITLGCLGCAGINVQYHCPASAGITVQLAPEFALGRIELVGLNAIR